MDNADAKFVRFEGQEIPYFVEVSKRSRKIRISVDPERGIRLVVPHENFVREGERFLGEQLPWVSQKWREVLRRREKHKELFEPLLEKSEVQYLGKTYQLVIEVGEKHWPPVQVEDNALVIYCVSEVLAEKILERWYRQQAKAVITGSLEYYRAQMNLKYNDLTIKDQKTRWGSCSSEGNLNFSWRLILSPKAVLDYVVIHELAHLVEMNHSSRFWALVERYCPDYKKCRKWLKENGVSLRI